jgi:hypothetical protein
MNAEQHTVLHGLYIKRYANAEVVAQITGVSSESARATIDAALAQGKVSEVSGRYTLTPIARVAHLANCSRFFGELRGDAQFNEAYRQFEEINVDLKAVITDWQTRSVAGRVLPNDHSDASYDDAVIDRLGRIHEKAEKVLRALAASLPRLRIYADRLEAAIEKAESGASEWVSDVKIDSYHTVWFELHEDLLCILARQRQE